MGAMQELFASQEATSSALQEQEISFDDPDSQFMFGACFYSTRGALETHGAESISLCVQELQSLARIRNGLDYLQVFRLTMCSPLRRTMDWRRHSHRMNFR